ncbi:MAG: glycosyltransferase family 2 protein [Acidimicrobiia bacterium]
MPAAVGVVVVNYNGGDLTLDCLRSLLATEWPADRLHVVLVDNASSDDVVARVRAELPTVHVVESGKNRGFGAGCNLGIRDLFDRVPDVEHVALVNNDATVDPGWLAPLVAALDTDAEVGAACPKILFAGRFRELLVQVPTFTRGQGDGRALGVVVGGVRVDGDDVDGRAQFVDGFWGVDPGAGGKDAVGAQWTAGEATVRVPADGDAPVTVSLLLARPDGGPAEVALRAGTELAVHTVDTEPRWCEVTVAGPGVTVVNNVGTDLTADGFGRDRGYLDPDDGRWDAPADVFAWCGGAVLLRRDYLDDVGLFAEELFLYYEDLELSWRGIERGWRHRTVPASVVHHVHAASTGRDSAFKRYFDERNHLVVLTRHASPGDAARAVGRSLLVTASYAKRDVLAPVLSGRPVRTRVVQDRLRAFGGYVKLLPRAVRERRGSGA